ncbi:hypothetical protein [Phenylobacterium sp.]|uniref:hypothetical protein n=1 Tax=Phenylobacterium sp. TaxID=1871053 RepID=UPI0026001E57|nr:hypothetical protein [Phenylobacterium sp.]
MSKQQLKKKDSTELAVGDISADLILKSAGKGLENITNDDITIPRLAIIQSGSPQRKKKDEKYIEGAEEGNIFNTVTNELYGHGIVVIPCGYRKSYVEWVPREKGGGLVAVHDIKPEGSKTDSSTRKTFLGENQIVDTAEHFVLVKKDKSYEPAVLTMTSSNLSVSRKWNTLLKMKRINVKGQTVETPSFMYEFRLSTVEAENDLGNWHKYKIEEIGQIESKDVFKQGQGLAESVTTGKVKASEPLDTDASEEQDDDDKGNNKKVPF